MPICDSKKLIFIHIPKNAGTSITKDLKMIDEGHHLPDYYMINYPDRWATYLKFAISRNPWDRFVSCYEYAKMKKSFWHSDDNTTMYSVHIDYNKLNQKSFEYCVENFYENRNWLEHQGWSNQIQYVISNEGKLLIDKVYDINEINSSDFINKIGLINQINKSSRKIDYKSYYTKDEYIEMIGEIYKQDIEYFGYEF